MELIVITGLPGSGSSKLAEKLQDLYGGVFATEDFEQTLRYKHRVVILTSPLLVLEKIQNHIFHVASKYGYTVRWYQYENSPQLALQNSKRKFKNGENMTHYLSERYHTPHFEYAKLHIEKE